MSAHLSSTTAERRRVEGSQKGWTHTLSVAIEEAWERHSGPHTRACPVWCQLEVTGDCCGSTRSLKNLENLIMYRHGSFRLDEQIFKIKLKDKSLRLHVCIDLAGEHCTGPRVRSAEATQKNKEGIEG